MRLPVRVRLGLRLSVDWCGAYTEEPQIRVAAASSLCGLRYRQREIAPAALPWLERRAADRALLVADIESFAAVPLVCCGKSTNIR